MATTAATPVATKLLQSALPLIPELGFTTETLVQAAAQTHHHWGSNHHNSLRQTIHSLFPSPPTTTTTAAATWPRRTGSTNSFNRQQLIDDARGQSQTQDRTGPSRALLEYWLLQARRHMSDSVQQRNQTLLREQRPSQHPKDNETTLIKHGVRHRLEYNKPVISTLANDLGLLNAPTSSDLKSITRMLPFPSPTPYLGHVATIAHDLAKATGDESQGLDWYTTRARIGTVYGAAELYLLSPSIQHLTIDERFQQTFRVVDDMLSTTTKLNQRIQDVNLFARWVGKSWAGMGRSLGL
ncbi:hypothetical protein OIO90_002056 [Microbotryomycetes sp. JL221]|nr:hypothetical protein OIO90_002056 [Microbotryomycetes sp. JL221]